jgi:uncharacterized protein
MRLPTLTQLLCVFALAIATPAGAQKAELPPDKIAAAKALFAAAGGREQASKAMDQMRVAMMAQLRQQDPAQAAKLDSVMAKLLAPDHPRVAAYLAEVEEAGVRFYAEKFSIDEMKAIAEFQGSAVGRKAQQVMPEMMAQIAGPFVKFQQGMLQDLQAEVRK